jgi:hypothetical protein
VVCVDPGTHRVSGLLSASLTVAFGAPVRALFFHTATALRARVSVALLQNSPSTIMPDDTLADQIDRLLADAQALASALDDGPDGRRKRRAHRLRETAGVLLILSERLARQTGNERMVTLDNHGDGTGTASVTVSLDDGIDAVLADN